MYTQLIDIVAKAINYTCTSLREGTFFPTNELCACVELHFTCYHWILFTSGSVTNVLAV